MDINLIGTDTMSNCDLILIMLINWVLNFFAKTWTNNSVTNQKVICDDKWRQRGSRDFYIRVVTGRLETQRPR